MLKQYAYPAFHGEKSDSYIATAETADIVNLAIRLGRPLLVEGEAGCGKTRLAGAIAEELGLSNFIALTVKSTSQAKDLLYRFDALRRLQDAQNKDKQDEAKFVYPYIELEPLGYAIQQGKPCLILIDEVDKADIDFPNDLLDVLDSFKFTIDDLPRNEEDHCLSKKGFGREVTVQAGGVKPVVVITSNREKQLPEPFLRRCLYIQLDFPKESATLIKIVQKNLAVTLDEVSDSLIKDAVQRFCEIRQRGQELNFQKLPATSELVDWVRVLHWQGRDADDIFTDRLSATDQAILFKIRQDIQRYRARTEEESGR